VDLELRSQLMEHVELREDIVHDTTQQTYPGSEQVTTMAYLTGLQHAYEDVVVALMSVNENEIDVLEYFNTMVEIVRDRTELLVLTAD
jgi:hypothetical protein